MQQSRLVIAKDLEENELMEIKNMIKGVCKGATNPMSEQLHLSSGFTLPENWTKPIDTEFSDILVSKIFNL